MAADRPLAERAIVEIKMGRSKFPGKPSKIGNRKRVNLSSCALPEDNDSSKAAKNIYLGLSVFNETFGDNEMVAPGPFHGFSMAEVEEAMAEARLQQNEAEVEHKKQGMSINLWDSFQNELFSIISCSSYNKNVEKSHEINKTKLSFDGGGVGKDLKQEGENTDNQLSKAAGIKSTSLRNHKEGLTEKKGKTVKHHSPRLKLQHSPSSSKSLQSQAAKKLLEKAKMANLSESNKSMTEKKFILPSHSTHSFRVIKPNKRFLEENINKRKFLRSRNLNCAYDKKPKVESCEELKVSKSKSLFNELKIDTTNEETKKKGSKTELSETRAGESKCALESDKNKSPLSSTGKVILREARLQLETSNLSLLEGPFSSPSASSLSPNSQPKVNQIKSVTAPGSIVCGVCGVVRFYRFVDLAKKFGIYCCESCRKFISKIIKTYDVDKSSKFRCVKGKGLCGILPIVRSQNFSLDKGGKNTRCQACWLRLCLKNFKMPTKLRHKLLKLLPVNMQMGVNLELSPIISNDIRNKFMLGNSNIKDFKWLNENSNSNEIKPTSKDSFSDKPLTWSNALDSINSNEKCLRKRNKTVETENKLRYVAQNGKTKTEAEEKSRQAIALKGPRVKHVCRSASVALGQPLATFPNEPSPTKKQTNESTDDCKNCDKLLTTNNCLESQGTADKSNKEVANGKQEKKPKNNPKSTGKPKKKGNAKAENPISMDFWESYDPEEVCETGFGLIGSESFSVRALCFLCGSSGQERLIHCASCCEPYHEFCIDAGQFKIQDDSWKYDWVCPRCTICVTCGRTSGQQLKCVKCDNSYHMECVDRVGGRLLHSPDRPWVCSVCLRCKSCNGVDVSIFVGNLPLCKSCFVLRQKGNYCPLCQRCYEDDDYDSKMMECGQCKCWVHAKCEGLSDEKYQVLSFLPESVEYVCRMCCVMPPAPWWIAVEAELKSGYLGVLKALSKNRKACTMLKWSPRKQCTCRQLNFVKRSLDFEENKTSKPANNCNKSENSNTEKENNRCNEANREENYRPGVISERKTSIEVINHPNESLKLTLKIMKGAEAEEKGKLEAGGTETDREVKLLNDKCNVKESTKCPLNEENSEDSLTNTFDCHEDSQASLQSLFKGNDFGSSELSHKRTLSSPLNPPSDSGIGSTDDELKANSLTDEESCRLDDQQSNLNQAVEMKSNCDTSVSFLEEKRECFCFLEVDSYSSRSKPFSTNLMSIKKKVTTSEYSSLHQFHQDMQRMIATTQCIELMDLYHQTIKEIFPWFDPKFSRVQNSSQKVSGTLSLESTPVKSTPTKSPRLKECRVPKEKLTGQCLDYFYSNYVVEDDRICLMCKTLGDGPPGETGRLLYCGQNEWVHCNCALWSGEVFEEIDGSLQNVHSAISRGRSIRCPECNLKGASIGCCARNCQETYHFRCARQVGCTFMDDKTVYCPAHSKESVGKLTQNEKEFEIRRPVYVELDKRKMKIVDSTQIRFAVGALHVNNLGKFIVKLSDQPESIVPDQFDCTRLFWSCYEPWRIVRYHFTVRLLEMDDHEGFDSGINLTVDHSKNPELVELKLKQLKHFQDHHTLLEIDEHLFEESIKDKRKLSEVKTEEYYKNKSEDHIKATPIKRPKKDQKAKKIFEQFDPKDDENCLSDNQNTADLLPPDIEEAIFKDLPHDILDGISMQDIFMDIKNDPYENGTKEGIGFEPEGEDISGKSRKVDYNSEAVTQVDIWNEDDQVTSLKPTLKKNKCEPWGTQQLRKTTTLKTYQKSLNWNNKTDTSNKWKKKCHVTVNLLEPQERGNMLQELKFTDGLVSVSTGAVDSMEDLKARLEESKRSIQQEEGKENKCLPWHTRLQPRLLQVDGGVDSSSSGSEAGESPQRMIEESMNPKIVALPQSSPCFGYFVDSPVHPGSSRPMNENLSPTFHCNFSAITRCYEDSTGTSVNPLPQLDGVSDLHSDSSDSEECFVDTKSRKRLKKDVFKSYLDFRRINFKINQCDGGIDSESDEGEHISPADEIPPLPDTSQSKDEPVKCNQCHCTYRTKISYQRHLEACSSDFMLSSSEGEMSEEESPKKQCTSPVTENVPSPKVENFKKPTPSIKQNLPSVMPKPANSNPPPPVIEQNFDNVEKLEVKKEKNVKRTYLRKKPVQSSPKSPTVGSFPKVQQILVQQPNSTPTLIVQDVPTPTIVPTQLVDSGSTIGYVTAVNPQTTFGKPQLIATPNGIISGNFQYPAAAEPQILGGLCLNPQNFQANVPGFIIQPSQPSGTLIAPQSAPIMMAGEQMMMGQTGLFDVIQEPGTGRMFLASHSQPVFYNMETIVSNTVMQTNQLVSNVLATSFSQTSTQIFQSREMEQVVNLPSNYILVGSNPAANKILSPNDLICVQTPQTFIPNQNSIQIPNSSIFNPAIPTQPTMSTEPKVISSQLNQLRCIQPLQVKQFCSPVVLNKITNSSAQVVNQPLTQVYRSPDVKPSPVLEKPVKQVASKPPQSNPFRSIPMMRPNVTKSPSRGFEKAVAPSKPQPVQQCSRALVDYINNFRSDICDTVPIKQTSSIKPASTPVKSTEVKEPVVSVTYEPKKQPVPIVVQKSSPIKKYTKSGKMTEPVLCIPNEEPKTLSVTPMPAPAPMPMSPKTDQTPVNSGKNNLSDIFPVSKSPEPQIEKVETEEECVSTSAKLSINKTNSLLYDRENKLSLSMPSLEDSLSEAESPNSTVLTSPKNENPVLPLQENSQSINTGKTVPKSPQKVSPNKTLTGSDEKLKNKKKTPSDQNSPETELLPEQTTDEKEEESFRKKIKNVKAWKKCEEKGPKLIFDVTSDDGFKSSSTSMVELWANICDSVQEMRAVLKIPPLPLSRKGHEILGMRNHGLQHCLEQLKGVEHCIKYKCKYFVKEARKDDEDEVPLMQENLTGCARTEKFTTRKEYDMFAWLASKHRRLPKLTESAEETLSSIRRANSLPMAMRYRNLKETAKLYVGVYRSRIHGRGLFCLREIEAGEMVIEYAGEVIRSTLTDKREKYYTEKGIGCYMFRIDDHFVIDATMKGNAARFINHSCEPNCYSRVVDILGKKHIVIFALRKINIMEELTYDYKFPFEDEKISCHCLSKKCRKYLN